MIRWKKSRIALALGLAVCLALGLLPGGAAAADAIQVDGRDGTVTLHVNETDFDALKIKDIETELYLVATVDAAGNYTAVKPFSDSPDFAAAISGLNQNTALGDLARQAQSIIYPEQPEGEEPEAQADQCDEETAARNGNVITFHKMGLYLLLAQDVITEEHEYSFMPLLLAMPALGTDEHATEGRPEGDEYDGQTHLDFWYDYDIYLKPESSDLEASLLLRKTLDSYNVTLGEVMFVFKITARRGDDIVFSQLVELTFNGTGLQEYLVEHIPAGTHVTVEEVYTGGKGYICVGSDNTDIEIIHADSEDTDPEVVTFNNTYDFGINPGVGVVNTITYNGDVDGRSTWNKPDQEYVGQDPWVK